MSLFDVDKSSQDRSTPATNHGDASEDRKAHGTNSVNYVSGSTDLTKVTEARSGRFTIVQTGTFTTTVGYQTSNPGAGNFITDNFTINTTAHNLGFVPAILAYVVISGTTYVPMPYVNYTTAGGAGSAGWYSMYVTADSTNVTVRMDTLAYGAAFSLAPPITFRWYLLQQRAN
jgi:hypothetical protein